MIIESVVVSLVTLAAACALQLDEQEGSVKRVMPVGEADIAACQSMCMGLKAGSGKDDYNNDTTIFKWEWEEDGKPCSAQLNCRERDAQLFSEMGIWCGIHDAFAVYSNDKLIEGKPYLQFLRDRIGRSDARKFEFNCGDTINIDKDDGDLEISTEREKDSPDNSGNIDVITSEVKVGGNGKVKKITTKIKDKKTRYVKDQSEEKF